MKILERLFWTAAGSIAGDLIGGMIGNTEEERQHNRVRGRWIGGGAGLTGTYVADEFEDTINYTLYNNGKRVYDGITNKDRVCKRLAEHKRDGKSFNKAVCDTPKPREQAQQLETYRIKRFKGEYNTHHNF